MGPRDASANFADDDDDVVARRSGRVDGIRIPSRAEGVPRGEGEKKKTFEERHTRARSAEREKGTNLTSNEPRTAAATVRIPA